MTSLAEQYRAERRAQSASMIYQEPAQRPAPVQIYDNTPPRTLADRAAAPVASKYEQRSGESDHAYVARLTPHTAHLAESLPAEELERVVAAYNLAVERINGGTRTHADLREQLDSRETGTGRGLLGRDEQEARQAALAAQSVRSNSLGGRIAQQGHLAAGVLSTPGQPHLSMLDRLPKRDGPVVVQRTAIPAGSSGTGWTTR